MNTPGFDAAQIFRDAAAEAAAKKRLLSKDKAKKNPAKDSSLKNAADAIGNPLSEASIAIAKLANTDPRFTKTAQAVQTPGTLEHAMAAYDVQQFGAPTLGDPSKLTPDQKMRRDVFKQKLGDFMMAHDPSGQADVPQPELGQMLESVKMGYPPMTHAEIANLQGQAAPVNELTQVLPAIGRDVLQEGTQLVAGGFADNPVSLQDVQDSGPGKFMGTLGEFAGSAPIFANQVADSLAQGKSPFEALGGTGLVEAGKTILDPKADPWAKAGAALGFLALGHMALKGAGAKLDFNDPAQVKEALDNVETQYGQKIADATKQVFDSREFTQGLRSQEGLQSPEQGAINVGKVNRAGYKQLGQSTVPQEGVTYHGSRGPIDNPSGVYNFPQSQNLLGSGFYTTDTPGVAGSYVKDSGRLYEVKWTGDKPPVSIDGDAKMSPDVKKVFNNLAEHYDVNTDGSLVDAFKSLRESLAQEGFTTKSEVDEIFNSVNHDLQNLGYDAIQHDGGKIVGKVPHKVTVYLSPVDEFTGKPNISLNEVTKGTNEKTQPVQENANGVQGEAGAQGAQDGQGAQAQEAQVAPPESVTPPDTQPVADTSQNAPQGQETASAAQEPGFYELLGPVEANSGVNLRQLADQFNTGKSGGKLYSTPFDKLKNVVSSGLQTMDRVAPAIAQAVRKLGNSKGEANLVSKGLVTSIDRQAGETGFFFKRVVPLIVDSRLQGIAGRYVDMGDLTSSLKVKRVMSDAEFAKAVSDPRVQAALKTYKSTIEKALSESHASNEGVFSDALGPLDTYYPLTRLDESGNVAQKLGGRRGALLQKPGNPRSKQATGMGEAYDLSPEGFTKAVTAMFHTNNRGAMVKAFEDSGLAKIVPASEASRHPTIEVNGVTWDARPVAIGQSGKVAIVPSGMAAELSHALAEGLDASSAKGFVNAANHFALQGVAEPVIHSLNLIGTIIAEPTVGGLNPFTRIVGNLPGIGSVSKLAETLATSTVDAQGIADLQDMARIGLLPGKTGSVTTVYTKAGRELAKATGAAAKFDLSPLLHGEKGIDTKARLYLYRLAKASGLKSDVDIAAVVNRLPEYNKAAEGILERGLKRSGVSPFYTAGKTMLRNGVDAFSLLNKGKRLEGSPLKNQIVLAHHLSHGVVGFTGMWIAANLAVTGKLPWEAGSQFGQINLGNGKAANLGIFNPVVMRGASALGIKGGYDAYAQGGEDTQPFQVAEGALKGSMNALMHPVTGGPLVKVGSIATTGSEPVVAGFRDFFTGEQKLSLYRGAPQTGSDQIKTNLLYGLANINSFALQALEKMGLVAPVYSKESDADPFAAMVELSGLKPLVQYDQEKKHGQLVKQAKLVEKLDSKQ